MVEAGADGVTEAEILDALDIAHGEIKKLVATMEELREQAGKEKIEVEAPQVDEKTYDAIQASHGSKLDEATQVQAKLERQAAIDAVEEEVLGGLRASDRGRAGRSRASRRGQGRLRQAREGHHPQAHRRRQEAPRRSCAGRDPADRDRGRRRAARARLSAVHPRGDADPLQRRARHHPDGHEGRQPRPAGDQAVLAPLQLPAVLGRGGRFHARPEAPRHRSWRARRAGSLRRPSRPRRISPT